MRGKSQAVKRVFRFHGNLFAPLRYIRKTSSQAVVNVADDELEKLWTNIITSIATYGLRLATLGRDIASSVYVPVLLDVHGQVLIRYAQPVLGTQRVLIRRGASVRRGGVGCQRHGCLWDRVYHRECTAVLVRCGVTG